MDPPAIAPSHEVSMTHDRVISSRQHITDMKGSRKENSRRQLSDDGSVDMKSRRITSGPQVRLHDFEMLRVLGKGAYGKGKKERLDVSFNETSHSQCQVRNRNSTRNFNDQLHHPI